MNQIAAMSWPEFLNNASLFDNAVRLRFFLWTLRRHAELRARLLEVGCGSGTTAVLLADLGYQVTACDIEPALVQRCAAKYSDWGREGRLNILQADMFKLPWPDKAFDLAYHQGVFEHFPDEQIIAGLREQGRVAFLVLFDVPNNRYGSRPFGDERLLSTRHWRKLIQAAGLEVVDERGRDFHRWLYWLPHGLFSHAVSDRLPWFARRFAVSSIFVCRSAP
ncbi:MAG TPA: class I SAM-dependent methyltransferase [Verrucomicrobiae bacterium]|nr:class I SAM-dependent methyltransferase [Verrucomicrobiae bacterium]